MGQFGRSYDVRRSFDYLTFGFCVIGAVLLGVVSTGLSGAWGNLDNLNVSTATPPNAVMYLAWGVAYLLMGISFFAVLERKTYTLRANSLKNISISLGIVQFLTVLLLPFLIYRLDLYFLAFVACGLITALLASLIVLNLKISMPAALLLLPCMAWMAFQTYLTLIIALNNF